MPAPVSRLVLLPGFDGTGALFRDFINALPPDLQATNVRYPADVCLSYEELMPLITSFMPVSEPFVLIAESFSTPLAMQFAATNPPNLNGLILCNGFATSPLNGWVGAVVRLIAPALFPMGLPAFAARFLLIGSAAPPSLLSDVRTAISSVRPDVLTARLRAVVACNARADLAKIQVPILYLRAKQDHLVPNRCMKEIQRIVAPTEGVTIPGPHLLFQRRAQETAEIAASFVKQLRL